jgi:hypothetical protein
MGHDEPPASLVWDLSDRQELYGILLGFGNGVFDEIRIVADSPEALELFRGIMMSGGYSERSFTGPSPYGLYQSGDQCFASFVFIDPTPRPEQFLDG